MGRMKAVFQSAAALTVCLLLSASTINPSTGDTAGRYMWVVIAVAAVAFVVLIVTAVIGRKNGKK